MGDAERGDGRDRREASRAAEALRRRTRALAAPHRAVEEETADRLLRFRRGAERFGVPLERVAATFTAAALTPVPGAEAPVRGVVAWRGRPLAVYDLAAATAPVPRPAPLVVVGDWRRAVALLADELEDAAPYERADRGDAPAHDGAGLVRALTADAVAVLDPDAVLSLFAIPR